MVLDVSSTSSEDEDQKLLNELKGEESAKPMFKIYNLYYSLSFELNFSEKTLDDKIHNRKYFFSKYESEKIEEKNEKSAKKREKGAKSARARIEVPERPIKVTVEVEVTKTRKKFKKLEVIT